MLQTDNLPCWNQFIHTTSLAGYNDCFLSSLLCFWRTRGMILYTVCELWSHYTSDLFLNWFIFSERWFHHECIQSLTRYSKFPFFHERDLLLLNTFLMTLTLWSVTSTEGRTKNLYQFIQSIVYLNQFQIWGWSALDNLMEPVTMQISNHPLRYYTKEFGQFFVHLYVKKEE